MAHLGNVISTRSSRFFLVGHATGTQLASVSLDQCLSDMFHHLFFQSLWSTLCSLILTAPWVDWQVQTVGYDEGVTHYGVVNCWSRIVSAGPLTCSGGLSLHRWIHYRHNIWSVAWLCSMNTDLPRSQYSRSPPLSIPFIVSNGKGHESTSKIYVSQKGERHYFRDIRE
jgi:hypothetical protein